MFNSSDDGSKEETRLSLYINLLSVSCGIYFGFVKLSPPWRRGHDYPTASPRQSLQRKAAGQLGVSGLPSPPDRLVFYEVHMEVLPTLF